MTVCRRRRSTVSASILAIALALTGCTGSGDDGGGSGQSITVWTMESLPERFQATQKMAAGFTAETGIEVELVGVEEAQAPQLIQSAALSSELPDVMGAFPLSLVHQLGSLEMTDTQSVEKIVEDLGPKTFEPAALELTSNDGEQLAVPSDAWTQVLVYRKDLFRKAGLEPPTTYKKMRKAARVLTTEDRFGIALATDPADVFTQQSFEALALGNDCQLVDDSGDIAIDSSQCRQTFELYNALGAKFSPSGIQSVDSTRATYFAGQSAMVLWSSFILDELAGLRNDALPNCGKCKGDKRWLAEHSGIVTSISGPDGKGPGSYGEITSWIPIEGGNPEASRAFIKYMMSDAYKEWLAMAPEGKMPMRSGTREDPEAFTRAWTEMDVGVDSKAPLGRIYGQQTIEELTSIGTSIERWALLQGKGQLAGSFAAELPLAATINEMTSGNLRPDEAANEVADAAEEILRRHE